jgi:hypothetical protein
VVAIALLKTFDAKFWGVVVMGGAVIILFFLPWLDKQPGQVDPLPPGPGTSAVRGVRGGSSMVLGYRASSRRRTSARSNWWQVGTLFYFGFFLLMPWWSQLGDVQAGARPGDLQAALTPEARDRTHDHHEESSLRLLVAALAPDGPARRRRPPAAASPGTSFPEKTNDLAAPCKTAPSCSSTTA